ncbi:hypothetical protein EGR_05353 [Echinococcus granulosus]|uniref:Uncharacterized protein n=1 Tax=Echinococcus granulosus TaxID=6210 RepID=W6UF44_ECHGR|nr:hypothetical protein EGR_05353 [Echinococcus granulosus]EUB59733.1 hypothetical protein EGR_05353 [Echinococcus granulosus]
MTVKPDIFDCSLSSLQLEINSFESQKVTKIKEVETGKEEAEFIDFERGVIITLEKNHRWEQNNLFPPSPISTGDLRRQKEAVEARRAQVKGSPTKSTSVCVPFECEKGGGVQNSRNFLDFILSPETAQFKDRKWNFLYQLYKLKGDHLKVLTGILTDVFLSKTIKMASTPLKRNTEGKGGQVFFSSIKLSNKINNYLRLKCSKVKKMKLKLSVNPFVHLSNHPISSRPVSTYPSIYPLNPLSTTYSSIHSSKHLSSRPPTHPFNRPILRLSIIYSSIHPSIHPFCVHLPAKADLLILSPPPPSKYHMVILLDFFCRSALNSLASVQKAIHPLDWEKTGRIAAYKTNFHSSLNFDPILCSMLRTFQDCVLSIIFCFNCFLYPRGFFKFRDFVAQLQMLPRAWIILRWVAILKKFYR